MKTTIVVIALVIAAARADVEQSGLAVQLAEFDATVFPPNKLKAAARMVEEDLDLRFREANGSSSAGWRSITTREDWEKFRRQKLAALRESLGQPVAPVPLGQRVTGTLGGDGYRIENVVYQSLPGFWITANLYRPDKPRPAMPGIIISHAHHTPKEHGELQDMGVTWARAGCYVLVPDHLGHGERRQHPFRSAKDYARPYQTGRQDYFFRYDAAMQLHLVGESLIGWMARDLMRGVDFLLAQENIDPKRIILLGGVAGGGEPAAVTAALDERIAAAVPFNFGGPQPETRYPLPDNAETWFDYAGGGSWESTRNLRRSATDGFLPWVIVGSIAPRRLIYGHEFNWDRDRDPVWKRLQTIYHFYQLPAHLAFTHGRGELRGQAPEATHCTHIGAPHREMIHAAFKKWFGIEVTSESGDRHPAGELQAMTPEMERELHPKSLTEILGEIAGERIGNARRRLAELPADQRRHQLRSDWSRLLGHNTVPVRVPTPTPAPAPTQQVEAESKSKSKSDTGFSVERIVLNVEPSIVVPMMILKLNAAAAGRLPVVVTVCQGGKQKFLKERSKEIAAILTNGMAVCLPDVRGTGETRSGDGGGRRSAATSLSSSELMLGGTTPGAQLRDLRSVLAWLRTRADIDSNRLCLWGDSPVSPNPTITDFRIPRDDDDALPRSPEPLGGLLALLAALFEEDIRAVYVHGGLTSFESVLTKHLALLPHDAVVPGVLTAGDLCDIVAALAPRSVRLEAMVDGWNQIVADSGLASAYEPAVSAYISANAPRQFSFSSQPTSFVHWFNSGKGNGQR